MEERSIVPGAQKLLKAVFFGTESEKELPKMTLAEIRAVLFPEDDDKEDEEDEDI